MENGVLPDNWDMSYSPAHNKITVGSENFPDFEMSVLHEVGHMLDYKILGNGNGYGTEKGSELLNGWREAIRASSAHKKLIEASSGLLAGDQPERLEYLLEDRELFARSYAQYISERSGNPVLLQQLHAAQESDKIALYANQWTRDDFKSIAKAFDRLFGRMRWLR